MQLGDYEQPYPALMVELPPGKYAPFQFVLCHKTDKLLTCQLCSADHEHDIVTTVAVDGRPIEESLRRYGEDCRNDSQVAGQALRVAVNSCLCLMEWGCKKAPSTKQRLLDRGLANEQSERGQRARARLRDTAVEVVFDRMVNLRPKQPPHQPGEATGGEMPFHFRRGHWWMAPCGPGRTERKRKLRKSCYVRIDKMVGAKEDYSTTYVG